MREVFLYNTLTRNKEKFVPLKEGYIGMYVCGPTVYGDGHLGHARPAITFDIVFRYFKHLGYKVRYVRNITDVGHLTNEIGEGDDKIQKKAKLEQLEPMEIVKYYVDRYHKNMEQLNVLPPSIEPFASGHVIEQIEYVKEILKSGFAYEKNGSVYFDLEKYSQKHNYGKLSGRVIDDLIDNTRDLNNQDEKNKSCDFALWKKADETHIMKWNSPWSSGFPGWHLECSAMGEKYLGKPFDIHGGGLDLMFPHHECEIAQSVAANGKETVQYWMHNNMITIGGQKMGKSLNNFITLNEFFSGNHKFLEQAYSPMTVRFFILQAQYRSTLDFSNEALQAAEKGMNRLFVSYNSIEKLPVSDKSTVDFKKIEQDCYSAMDDDFNTPIVISNLFEAARLINCIKDGKEFVNQSEKDFLKDFFSKFLFDILGLKPDGSNENNNEKLKDVMGMILGIRADVKKEKNFSLSDKIRDNLKAIGIEVKDGKDGAEWSIL